MLILITLARTIHLIPIWFKRILFLYGLPRVGKTLTLYKIINKDHGKDLILNLRKHKTIDGMSYTVNYIKARKRKPIQAYRIPKHRPYARYAFLKLFKLEHPRLRHILIDEIERYRLHRLIHLCRDVHRLYPNVPIILVGIMKDDRNRIFRTSQYILDHCQSRNMNPHCKFCHNRASYMLNVFGHEKITYDQIDRINNAHVRKHIKHRMDRIHVCKKHYFNPPIQKL